MSVWGWRGTVYGGETVVVQGGLAVVVLGSVAVVVQDVALVAGVTKH